ncbi:hypothetical protein [Caulobacter sp. FWC26]|uniref:hypothetical protein n=1 Tax=Caulobacter sp. FWC26 TaxID=69665 RepID=UPI00143CFE06|nr:hypothetical protein [Caulobacter sp. FWC26]
MPSSMRVGEETFGSVERGCIAQPQLVHQHAAARIKNPLERGALGVLAIAH